MLPEWLTRRFWLGFAAYSLAAFGAIAFLSDILSLAYPNWLPFKGGRLMVAFSSVAVLFALWRSWPRPIEQSYAAPNTRIRIVKGDLLDQATHLVVGVCDTFDTSTPRIISENSLQGQLQRRYYGNDIVEFDRKVEEALAGKLACGVIHKEGKTQRYPVGTVATLRERGRCIFLLAYSEMDENNNARASVDGLWTALSGLWREVERCGNGDSISISVVGGGLSRLSQVLPAQDAIKFLVLSFMLASRRARLGDELRIVVRPDEYEKLDLLELQAFLTSLRPS